MDVYNLHMDAGDAEDDQLARSEQVDQLIERILDYSDGRAVIVAGDTNLNIDRELDEIALQRLMAETGLQDVCRYLECGVESIDRILFRSGAGIDIAPISWWIPEEFVDDNGDDLSDHKPVAAEFEWETARASSIR